MKRKLFLSLVSVMLAAVVTLGGCGGASQSSPADPAKSTAEGADTPSSQAASPSAAGGAASGDKVTLTVWDMKSDPVGMKMLDTINAAYEAKFPAVAINRAIMTQNEMMNTIKPAIQSGNGPDVASYTPGPGYVGALVDGGLVYDLTEAAVKYNWKDRFFDFALKQTTFDGKLYALPVQMDLLGMYYNKQIFADNNITIPTTYNDFLKVCETLKANGVQPILIDDKDQWPGFHYESMWQNSSAGADKIAQALRGEIPWTSQGFGEGLDALYHLIDAGYANNTVLSIGYDDLNAQFIAGTGAMRPTGTWMLGKFFDEMGDTVGMFNLPPMEGVTVALPSGIGQDFLVNSKTNCPDEALEYMDFIFSPEVIPVWFEGADIPFVTNVDSSKIDVPDLTKDVINALNDPNTSLGYNLDVLLPNAVNDAAKNYMQEVLAGRITGQQAMETKQKVFESAMKSGDYTPIV